MNIERFRRRQCALRDRLVDKSAHRVLVASLHGSREGYDRYNSPNCEGFGRVRVYRDFRLHFANRVWPRRRLSRTLPPASEYRTQVFQIAGCDFRCWYCYVDDALLRADGRRARMFTAAELIELAQRESSPPAVIDLSGGQPELVPEWTLWMMEEMEARGLAGKVAVWCDDNLSCDFFWTELADHEREYIARFPGHYRMTCLKGFDPVSFAANAGVHPELFHWQLQLLRRLAESNIEYGVYLTMLDVSRPAAEARVAIENLLDQLEAIDPDLPARVIPLRIHPFGNTLARATHVRLLSLGRQDDRFDLWVEHVTDRYGLIGFQDSVSQHLRVETPT